jgi:capsular polysaccharide transport system permease protein
VTTQLARSFVIQSRVVFALLMREVLTRYGRHNIGFLWLFFEPMMFTLGITAMWNATMHASQLPITAFAVTGYSTVLLWRNMPSRCIESVTTNLQLMYHRNVKVIDIFLSRLLLEAVGATISYTLLIVFFWYIGLMELPEDVLKVLGAWALLAWFGAALAILLGSLSERTELVDRIWHPLAYIIFPISGAAFMVDSLPPGFQDVVLWVPMVHGMELMREGYFGSQIRAHYDVSYLALVNLGLTFLGLQQSRLVSKFVVPE